MELENHTRRAFVKGALAASALALLSPAVAWAAGWVRLGTRTVLLANDTDIVPVTLLRGTFTHLQLRVKGNGIYMNALRVTFSNRQSVNLPVPIFHSGRRSDAPDRTTRRSPSDQLCPARIPLGAEIEGPRNGGSLGAPVALAPAALGFLAPGAGAGKLTA